jgi:hypothetical protein
MMGAPSMTTELLNMKSLICKTARNLLLKTAAASVAATLSLDASAQPTPADVEELVEYAQCIRANGYAEFPDPTPEGRMQLRIDRASAGKFEAAQRACTDELPSGMAAMNAPMTPERLEALVEFAECMRASGVPDFPDPSPQGQFELTRAMDMGSAQARQAVETCRESNSIGGLMIHIGG